MKANKQKTNKKDSVTKRKRTEAEEKEKARRQEEAEEQERSLKQETMDRERNLNYLQLMNLTFEVVEQTDAYNKLSSKYDAEDWWADHQRDYWRPDDLGEQDEWEPWSLFPADTPRDSVNAQLDLEISKELTELVDNFQRHI